MRTFGTTPARCTMLKMPAPAPKNVARCRATSSKDFSGPPWVGDPS